MTATITKHMIKTPNAGKGVLSWIANDGEQAEAGRPIALFTVGTVAHEVLSPSAGRVYRVTPNGVTLAGNSVVGRVHEGESGNGPVNTYNRIKSPTPFGRENNHVPTEKRTYPPLNASEPQIMQEVKVTPATPSFVEAPKARRGTHIEPTPLQGAAVLAGQVVELPSEKATKGTKKPQAKKTKNRTYSIGDHQEGDIAKLSKALQLEALDNDAIPACNESEIVRAAVDLLLGLPRPALLEVLRANREREKVGKWGRGRPRPGK